MSIIDRYVARSFTAGYLILLAVSIGVSILADVLVNIDEFLANEDVPTGQVLGYMVAFYGHNTALYFSQFGGPLLAVAAAFTIGAMLRNNEMNALVSAGMPLQRLAAPVRVCTALFLAVWVANKELLIPQIAHKIARDRGDVAGTRTAGVPLVRDGQRALLTAQRLDPRRGTLERLQIIVPDEHGPPTMLIDADEARYDPARQTWKLVRGRWLTLAQPTGFDRPLRWEPCDEYPLPLTPELLVLHQGTAWSDMLSLRQMNALVHSPGLPNRPAIIVNRHVRMTQPLIYLIRVPLALPFFLTREPCNVLAAGGRALLLCGLFLGLTFVAHGIINEQGAALRAWAPILCFGPLAVLQLANART